MRLVRLTDKQLAAYFADRHASQIPYDTSPRHLAGPGDARHVTHGLAAAGWSAVSDPLGADIRLRSPDHRCHMEFTPRSPHWAWWTLWATDTDAAPSWFANFGAFVPAEVLAGLTDALIAPQPAEPADVMEILKSAGWRIGQRDKAASPDAMCHVEQRSEPVDSTPYWYVETCEPGHERHRGLRIWDARFSDYTPEHLVAAFVTALADPGPLHRGVCDPAARHAVQEPSRLSPADVVEAHARRIASLRRTARAARQQNQAPAARTAKTGTARTSARR